MIGLGSILFYVLIVGILYVMFIGIRTALDYAHRPKPVTLTTGLADFKESHTIDNKFEREGSALSQNTTLIYERDCVAEPKDSIDLEDIAKEYGRYLRGELLDPEGKHAPSEFIEDERNPDYRIYLDNQMRALAKKGDERCHWFKSELERVGEENEYLDIKEQFKETLIKQYRFPEDLVPLALNDTRMEEFTQHQWKNLSSSVRNYLGECDAYTVGMYLILMDDYEHLVSIESFEKFQALQNSGVPFAIAKENILGSITDEQMLEVITLVDSEYLEWKEALFNTLKREVKVLKDNELKRKYRNLVEGR